MILFDTIYRYTAAQKLLLDERLGNCIIMFYNTENICIHIYFNRNATAILINALKRPLNVDQTLLDTRCPGIF